MNVYSLRTDYKGAPVPVERIDGVRCPRCAGWLAPEQVADQAVGFCEACTLVVRLESRHARTSTRPPLRTGGRVTPTNEGDPPVVAATDNSNTCAIHNLPEDFDAWTGEHNCWACGGIARGYDITDADIESMFGKATVVLTVVPPETTQ